jgi:radical SAM superfamily enzyme YgiQ (UPF0313 family)
MRILLVKPRWFVHGGHYRFLEHVRFSPLSLGILAALSDGHQVRVVDGDWEEIPCREQHDLVGITVTTFTSQRAYRLARQFAGNGAKVVLGGVHPSILPDECLESAHAVVVGEAEHVWPEILRDAQAGALRRVYAASGPTDMRDVPFPRRDLLRESSWFSCIQATRGCTNACRYCYLPSVPWRAYRTRPIELVCEELSRLPQRLVFFVDDNLFADRAYALGLLRAVASCRKTLAVQAPATMGNDDEMLDVLAAAGFFNLQVGFQSFSAQSLDWAGVGQNRVSEYRALVDKLHARGILVTGFFMFGFDTDDAGVFGRTLEMIKRTDLDDAHLYILTPYPGTALYAQFRKEGRLLPEKSRAQFGWAHAVFRPKQMTAEELERGVQRAYDQLLPYIRRHAIGALWRHLGLFLRHPALVRVFLTGLVGRRHVADETEPTQ